MVKFQFMAQIIYSSKAPEPIGPYSQAIKAGNTLYCSGQIAIDAESGKMVDEDVTAETRQVLRNLRHVLEAAGMGMENVVKCSIFLSDMALFDEVNKVYSAFFSEVQPARETVAVAGLPKGVRVEISAVAIAAQ